MAGHSHAKNVMHQKSKSEAKRSKIFAKLAREIIVSAKSGMPDPAHNPRLRAAIQDARKNNMPNDRIQRAIKSAQPGSADNVNYDEVRYEGYGPGGTAFIVEALSDNRNRTAAELRAIFSKNGGAIGEAGSVAFMFTRLGELVFPAKAGTADEVLEAAIEAGADDAESDEEAHVITCSVEDFGAVRAVLEEKFGEADSAKLTWYAKNEIEAVGDAAQSIMKFIDALEDNDDVQNVFNNVKLDELEM
ncbi:MAG: YebC/PmpR family DNA-binding transcriptional regulator [Alphaproteobacteria bacterium]|nr:YebC/PmpR family DNA-binding transcriptional regulator [Alphaproteobacteria bacterium]MCL2504900.1 YebC/PmpR family DNA-binding transcriptional regulator [Alphaproteobacteria bacterium]